MTARPRSLPAAAGGLALRCLAALLGLAVLVSGVKLRSWLGRNPASSEPAPVGAAISPPLSATPGGVIRRQPPPRAGRANICQKFSCAAALPPISTIA